MYSCTCYDFRTTALPACKHIHPVHAKFFPPTSATKLLHANRTVYALAAERWRLVVVKKKIPGIVFRRCLEGVMRGHVATPKGLSERLPSVCGQSLARRHHAGDFCLISPLFKCTHNFPNSSLTSPSLAPHSPGSFAEPPDYSYC